MANNIYSIFFILATGSASTGTMILYRNGVSLSYYYYFWNCAALLW